MPYRKGPDTDRDVGLPVMGTTDGRGA